MRGADGVFIGGCHLNECHYLTDGNYYALNMVQLSRKLLEHIGLSPERVRIEEISSGEGTRFAEIMRDFGKQIKNLGPLGKGEGIDESELRTRLGTLAKMVPYIKLVKREKLALRRRKDDTYKELFTNDEIQMLFRDVVSYYIDPDKCQACMICAKRCPVEAIAGGKNQIHVIDQEKCIKCGACVEACPHRFSAVTTISGGSAPSSIPEASRTIDRKSKRREVA
jgi:F420-non-reducing hydrogenase iron-sulfur subunit